MLGRLGGFWGLKSAQVGTKLAKNCSNLALSWPKLAPSSLQVGPKLAKVGSSWPQVASKLASSGPKLDQVGPKQVGLKLAPSRSLIN